MNNPKEPLLTTYLREAVEALRNREFSLEVLEGSARRMEEDGGAKPWPATSEEARGALILTRAALAFWERLAAVDVQVSEHPGVVVFQVPYEDDGFSRAWGQRVELFSSGEWCISRQPAEYGEAGGLACLAAALECRRRNEGEAILSRSDDEVLADCQARGEDPAEVAQRVKAALMAGVERHFGPKEASNEQP